MEAKILYDFDSMIYKAVYKITDIQTIKKWFYEGKSKEWMRSEIVELSINRLCNMSDAIFTLIENTGIEVGPVEYYITACKNSARKKIYPEYKTNRKPNKWVNKVRAYLLDKNFAVTSDEWEADDLIYDRAIELKDQCVILSIDKDLKQIPGVHFNYYKPIKKDENGNKIDTDVVGLSVVSEKEANYSFWLSMLVGDSGDNIKGCKGIGKVKGEKLLNDSLDYEKTVKEAYKKVNPELWEIEYQLNYQLLKLGKK